MLELREVVERWCQRYVGGAVVSELREVGLEVGDVVPEVCWWRGGVRGKERWWSGVLADAVAWIWLGTHNHSP